MALVSPYIKAALNAERVIYAGAMPAHRPELFHLETERLTMRFWAESDVDNYRALVAERDDVMPTVENIRAR